MRNVDSHSVIGKSHKVCQDYSLAITSSETVVLSDGCSSSPMTDWGSRLLCLEAAENGPELACSRIFGSVLPKLSLPPECLDATLLHASVMGDCVRAKMLGDGLIVGRRRGGGWVGIKSEFPSGAPRYSSYDLDPARRENYLKAFGASWVISTFMDGSLVMDERRELKNEVLLPYVVDFQIEEFDLVLLMSDGVFSFSKPDGSMGGRKGVPLEEVVSEMLQIKGFAGEFIFRRMRKFLKDSAAAGWSHDDDFSVAGIHLGGAS